MAERQMIVNIEDFPSNSNKVKEKVKVEKIVKGKIKKRKKGIGEKLSETFLEDDAQSVGSYILWDILIPTAKELIVDMVTKSINMFFYGDDSAPRSGRVSRDRNKSFVSYSSYYDNDRRRNNYERKHNRSGNRAVRHNFNDILFETRSEAEDVLSAMIDLIDDYDIVSIADFYGLIGAESSYVDNNWGWDNLSSSSVDRVRDGYVILLPRPIEIG